MNDERFEELMRDAANTYRKPPVVDFDEMWAVVEERRGESGERDTNVLPIRSRRPLNALRSPLIAAAALLIGVLIGRASISAGAKQEAQAPAVVASTGSSVLYGAETSKYLGQTAALLIALPSEVRAGRADEQFVGRASELLSRTRLLIDSPAANDPQMRDLLEDLELVLAQIVRIQNDTTSRTELDLISRALEQRDVIPRLRTAVADISAN